MKTRITSLMIISCLVLMGTQTVSSQLKLGVRGGVDVISSKVDAKILNVDNRMGYRLGMAVDFTVPLVGIGVESGLLFGQERYKGEEHEWDGAAIKGKMTNYNYLTVPLLFKQKISLFGLAGVYYKGGVYGNFRLGGGKLTLDTERYSPRTFQTGLTGGVGVSLLKHVELGLDYRHRLTDAYSSNSEESKTDELKRYNKLGRNHWTVTLAFYY